MRLLRFIPALVVTSAICCPAHLLAAPDSAKTFSTSPVDVDRYPYPAGSSTFVIPDSLRFTKDHYFICTAMIDIEGRVLAASALGCDGEKALQCDFLDSLLPTLRFISARKHGQRVAATVVFPALLPAKPDSVGSFGPPTVGDWQEGQCAYHTRIYGADELPPADRPHVIHKPVPKYPATAKLTGQGGEALINMVVGPDGLPCFVLCEAVRPVGMGFTEAAVNAAWQYRFTPGTRNGQPQAVWVKIPFHWEP